MSRDVEETHLLFSQLRRHEPEVRGYLRARFPSIDTDDVVQESYLKILRAKTASRIAATKAYFFTVARNTAHTFFQRTQRLPKDHEPRVLCDDQLIDPSATAAESADQAQRLDLVVQAVDQLPARCREIISLAVLQGLSSREIAQHLRLSENTVRVQLARGVKKCAEFIRTKGEQR